MPFFVFQAKLPQIPPGVIPAFIVCADTLQNAYGIARTHHLGTNGVPYRPSHAKDQGSYVIGNVFPPAPALSQAGVQGGQPVGAPVAQPNAPGVPRGVQFGFEKLGGDALPRSQDNMFGDLDDGTMADLYNAGSGASQEIPRPDFTEQGLR